MARETRRGVPVLSYVDRPARAGDLLLDARRWASRTHIVQGDRRLTFEAHEAAVRRLAARLHRRGVGPGDVIALTGRAGPEWVVAYWAGLIAGAVVAPLNGWWSRAETDHAIRRCRPTLIVGDAPAADMDAFLRFEEVRAVIADDTPAAWPEPTSDENDPALILFTAGTSGLPKGVTLSHGAVVAGVQNLLAPRRLLPTQLDLDHRGVVSLMTVPLFHIGGVGALAANLLCAGRMVFLEGRFDPAEVIGLIGAEHVTTWGAIPTMVSRVADRVAAGDHRDLSTLTSLVMGGASVPEDLRALAMKTFPALRAGAGNTYGMTEAGGHIATASGREATTRPGTSGRPLPVVELRIAPDPEAPAGAGEILVRSPSLMSGYWGEPDLGVIDRAGWLHTGDLGRTDDDGYLFVVGRNKDVIIRGGENIAAPLVEATLSTHPAVREVAVVGLPHRDLGEEVAVIVVVHHGHYPSPEDLSRFAAERLARFEVPSRWWIRTDPLPTNAVGKILKRQLRDDWQSRITEGCEA